MASYGICSDSYSKLVGNCLMETQESVIQKARDLNPVGVNMGFQSSQSFSWVIPPGGAWGSNGDRRSRAFFTLDRHWNLKMTGSVEISNSAMDPTGRVEAYSGVSLYDFKNSSWVFDFQASVNWGGDSVAVPIMGNYSLGPGNYVAYSRVGINPVPGSMPAYPQKDLSLIVSVDWNFLFSRN